MRKCWVGLLRNTHTRENKYFTEKMKNFMTQLTRNNFYQLHFNLINLIIFHQEFSCIMLK